MTPADRNDSREQTRRVTAGEVWDAVREGEAPSLASIWRCPRCGAQVQILIAPKRVPRGPFICVDGTPMVPGKEH